MIRLGINRALWLFGVVQMVSILGFAVLAGTGPLIWLLAAGQVIRNLDTWYLVVAYAGGFATGNIVGSWLEAKLAMGLELVRILHHDASLDLPRQLRRLGYDVTCIQGVANVNEPVEILRMATGTAGELFKMSGLRNPYPDGDLGVVKEGAYADLLLVDGNPLEDLGAVTDSNNLKIIMKDGKIYKNTL